MQKALTLSIVIPVYNEEYYLKRCLKAVSRQTIKPAEIIVVDNNSTDQTVAIAKRFQHVRVVTEKKQGVLFATRTGFDQARGDIICRIDADTIVTDDWLEQVRNCFIKANAPDAITGNCYFYDFPMRSVVQVLHHTLYYHFQRLVAGTEILWGSNMAITSSAWHAVRPDCLNHPGIHEDIDLSFHLQNHQLHIRRVPDILVGVSMLRGSLSPAKIIRYLWPWPNNTLQSYFWSWPRTYWINQRYLQAIAITVAMLLSGLLIFPFASIAWLIKLSHFPKA